MPKTLILFRDTDVLVDAVADGARSVRFAEVEVRHVGEAAMPGHQTFEGLQALPSYDAIIVAAGAGDVLAGASPLVNKVGAAFTASASTDDAWPTLKAMAALGMLLVPPAVGEDAARALGKRVAEVAGWITHARSHHHH